MVRRRGGVKVPHHQIRREPPGGQMPVTPVRGDHKILRPRGKALPVKVPRAYDIAIRHQAVPPS